LFIWRSWGDFSVEPTMMLTELGATSRRRDAATPKRLRLRGESTFRRLVARRIVFGVGSMS
jgi:hypothetical protein